MTRHLAFSIFAALALSACSTTSTTFTDTWKDPEAQRLDFKKILTVVITDEDIIRRSAETRLAKNITKAEAVPSYTFLTRDDLKDVERAKAKVLERGFDGAIVLRIVAVDEEQQYVSGRYVADPSMSFWGYYGYYWPRVYEPGYAISKQVVIVESKIYSVKDEKMVWSGLSRTIQPESVKRLIDELAEEGGKVLREQGLID